MKVMAMVNIQILLLSNYLKPVYKFIWILSYFKLIFLRNGPLLECMKKYMNYIHSSRSIDGFVDKMSATVETALANSFGDGERLNDRFSFSNTGDVRVGG